MQLRPIPLGPNNSNNKIFLIREFMNLIFKNQKYQFAVASIKKLNSTSIL